MLAFAFLSPSILRLQLERIKYEGVIIPSALSSAPIPAAEVYKNEVAKRRRQTPVFIYPDVKTFAVVVRGGAFDQKGKHIVCGAASELAQHGLDPMDGARHSLVWRLKLTAKGTINARLDEDLGVPDAVISNVSGIPFLPEHKFSNPIVKLEDAPYTDAHTLFADIYRTCGGHAAAVAVIKYLSWSYTPAGFRALGSGSFYALHKAAMADKRLVTANTQAFSSYVKQHGIQVTKDILFKVRSMLASSIPAVILEFVRKHFIERRPFSLALAESACSPSIGTVIVNQMKFEDFPVDAKRVEVKPRVDPKASSLTINVVPGQYTLRALIGLISDKPDELYREACSEESKIVVSRNPDGFRGTLSLWDITTNTLELKVRTVKYRFEAQIVEKQVDAPISGVKLNKSKGPEQALNALVVTRGEKALRGTRKRPSHASTTMTLESGSLRGTPGTLKKADDAGQATPVEATTTPTKAYDARQVTREEAATTPRTDNAPVRAKGARQTAIIHVAKPPRASGLDVSKSLSTKAVDTRKATRAQATTTPSTSTQKNTGKTLAQTTLTGRGDVITDHNKLTEAQLRTFMSKANARLILEHRAKGPKARK